MVFEPPIFTAFKPTGLPDRILEEVTLSLDEYEALRLADHLKLSHEEAASEMEVSRPTFTRLIEKSRTKVAEMIIKGKVLSIDGGDIHFKNNLLKCIDCGHLFKIKIGATFSECPDCLSGNLINFAGGFGHGHCCFNHYKVQNHGKVQK